MKKKKEVTIKVTVVNNPSKEAVIDFTNELMRLYNETSLANEQLEENAA